MLSFVIPVYRSADALSELYRRISQICIKNNNHFEILFVEDYGGDHSWAVICDLSAQDPAYQIFKSRGER